MAQRTPMVASGDLRHRVTHQSNRPRPGAMDIPVDDWSDVNTYWANVRALAGQELWYAQQIDAQTTHAVTLRIQPSMPPVAASDRFLWNGRVLNILGIVDVDNRGIMYEARCVQDDVQDPAPAAPN